MYTYVFTDKSFIKGKGAHLCNRESYFLDRGFQAQGLSFLGSRFFFFAVCAVPLPFHSLSLCSNNYDLQA